MMYLELQEFSTFETLKLLPNRPLDKDHVYPCIHIYTYTYIYLHLSTYIHSQIYCIYTYTYIENQSRIQYLVLVK